MATVTLSWGIRAVTITEISPWISATKDILIGFSAWAAAAFAYLGLTTWRAELKGRSEYQLAKDVLKSVYKVRDAFMHVRHPAIWQYEYPEEMTDRAGHLKPDCNYEGTAHVYQERWKRLAEAFGELEEYHLAAQVEWGPEFQNRIVGLRNCKAQLQVAIQQWLEALKEGEGYGREISVEERARRRSIIYYWSKNEEDQFTPQIEAAIDEFETWLRPHIRSQRR